MKDLLPYYQHLKPCRGRYILGMVAGVINGVASGFGMAFILAKVLPQVFAETPQLDWALIGVVLLLPGIAVIRGISAFSSIYLMGYCSNRVCLNMRKGLMEHMQKLSLSFYHKTRTGMIMARVLNDTEKISSFITQGTSDLIRQPVTIVGAFAVIAYLAHRSKEIYILLIVIAILPLCILLIRSIGRKIAKREQQMGNTEGSLNSIIHENVESARETRAFDLHEREAEKFERKAMRQFGISMRLLTYKNIISPSVEVFASMAVAAAILFAALAKIPLETIIPIAVALYACYQPVKKIGVVYANMKRASMAVNRLKTTIYNSSERLEISSNPMPCMPFKGSLDFCKVSFKYNKNAKALRGVSTSIRHGEAVALVGPSGSGKSTFCNLLCRFYDPKQGAITYDGTDLRHFNENDYRRHIAIVPQDSFLFADSIMNNIRVGRLDATDEDVVAAAKNANAHDFIEQQPDGYETVVAERGVSLSGGQRQRIAIARAFLRNSEILILDEATSAIDAKSEKEIHSALQRLFEDRTVIIIAHRYSTIRMARRILLFHEGKIEMDGTDTELEAGSEFFRTLKQVGIEPGLKAK